MLIRPILYTLGISKEYFIAKPPRHSGVVVVGLCKVKCAAPLSHVSEDQSENAQNHIAI